jgi:NAD(P)-dependent dehydrogenase (short-subunit alcohol dehydrogenase family)
VTLAARDTQKLASLAAETRATTVSCDATNHADVERLFAALDADSGKDGASLDLVVYNASARAGGAFTEIDPEAALRALTVTAFGGFLVAQQAARRMLAQGHGTILLTGASASVKGYPRSAVFAMGKFALRGLAQSLARELQPQNIHVAHVVIDGGILKEDDPRHAERGRDGLLEPDAIAATYLALHRQHRTAWASEIELRPWVEKF